MACLTQLVDSSPPLLEDQNVLILKNQNRLQKGPCNHTSSVACLTLSVLSMIMIYLESIYVISKWVIGKIDFIRRSFLWSHDRDNKGYCIRHLVSWMVSCSSNHQGWLGVLNPRNHKYGQLTKYWWKLWSSIIPGSNDQILHHAYLKKGWTFLFRI